MIDRDGEKRRFATGNRDAISFVQSVLFQRHPGVVLEIGCGRWGWQTLVDFGPASYFGIDDDPAIVAENRAKHGRDGVQFMHAEVLAWELGEPDVIICRDTFQRLATEDAVELLEKIRKATPLLVAGTNRAPGREPIPPRPPEATSHPVDLCKAPLSLKPYRIWENMEHGRDDGGYRRHIALFDFQRDPDDYKAGQPAEPLNNLFRAMDKRPSFAERNKP